MTVETCIDSLISYAMNTGLAQPEDHVFLTNRLLETLNLDSYTPSNELLSEDLEEILAGILEYACENGLCDRGSDVKVCLLGGELTVNCTDERVLLIGRLSEYPSVCIHHGVRGDYYRPLCRYGIILGKLFPDRASLSRCQLLGQHTRIGNARGLVGLYRKYLKIHTESA